MSIDDFLRDERLLAELELQGLASTPAQPAMSEPLMMDASDVARELGVSVRTVRRLDLAAKLPRGLAVGRGKRWRRAELRAWVNAGCPPRDEWTWKPRK